MAAEKPVRTVSKKASTRAKVSMKAVVQKATQFLSLKAQAEQLDERVGTLKKELSVVVEEQGYTDDKGNLWLDMDEPVEVPGWGKLKALKREVRRSNSTIDADAAEKLLKKKGLYDECSVTIRVLDEEAINKAYFQKRLTKAEIDRMYPTTETWAFKPIKA